MARIFAYKLFSGPPHCHIIISIRPKQCIKAKILTRRHSTFVSIPTIILHIECCNTRVEWKFIRTQLNIVGKVQFKRKTRSCSIVPRKADIFQHFSSLISYK